MYVYLGVSATMHLPRGQKKTMDTLELESQLLTLGLLHSHQTELQGYLFIHRLCRNF